MEPQAFSSPNQAESPCDVWHLFC